VHSGSLLEVFQDDRTYPFEAHAPFKVWAPLADAPDSFIWFQPGSRPRLLLHQPRDYWYQAAQTPSDYWVEHFDVRSVANRSAARAELPKDLSRTAYLGDALPELAAWGVRAVNPPALVRRLDYVRAAKTPYELVCLREANRLHYLVELAPRRECNVVASCLQTLARRAETMTGGGEFPEIAEIDHGPLRAQGGSIELLSRVAKWIRHELPADERAAGRVLRLRLAVRDVGGD
jgi:hypothetical protein